MTRAENKEILMGYAGDGEAPPPSGGGGGARKSDPMYGFTEKVTKTVTKDGKSEQRVFDQRVKTWYVSVGGKDKPILMLDPMGDHYTCRIHVFIGPDGKKGSMVRCIAKSNPKGCPNCEALGKEGTWYYVLTGIDQSKFIPNSGSNKGKVYTNFRRLVLVTSQQYDDMKSLEKKEPGGWRGRTFDVSRSEDTKSYKIGSQWYPTNAGAAMTDEEIHAMLDEAAASYGLSVEDFCTPLNLDVVLKKPSFEEAVKIAKAIEGAAGADGSGEGEPVPTGDTAAVEY